MLMIVWSYIMPFILAVCLTGLLAKKLLPDKKAHQAIMKARQAIMSEAELELAAEGQAIKTVSALLRTIRKYAELDDQIIVEMGNMLRLMGSLNKPEKELARYIVRAIGGAVPIIVVPVLTGFEGYLLLYPLAVVILVLQQYKSLKKQFNQWQKDIIVDLPALIDKLRISFSCGKDYVSAFIQVRELSGLRMKTVIDNLINDLQYLRPALALDSFAESFNLPVVNKFTSAVKIAIEHGYEAAESYFAAIEDDISEVRKVAIEEKTKSKPEKVVLLYLIIISLSVGSLLIKGWEIFNGLNTIM